METYERPKKNVKTHSVSNNSVVTIIRSFPYAGENWWRIINNIVCNTRVGNKTLFGSDKRRCILHTDNVIIYFHYYKFLYFNFH